MTSSTPAVSIVPTAEGFLVSEDGQDVLFYQRETKRFDENYSRSHYIHPLFGLDGELLTEEFPADHPHHCGVYWAWHQVWMREKRIGDAWSLRDFAWDVQDVKVIASDSHAALEADVKRAIRLTRHQARKWNIDPAQVGVFGFSAGGHVASTAATHFDAGNPKAKDPVERLSCRPDFLGLGYPLLSMQAEVVGTRYPQLLLGPKPSQTRVRAYSNELQVTPDTPQSFICHAENDTGVKVENTRRFAAACRKAGVACTTYIRPDGGHGFGIRDQGHSINGWHHAFAAWLKNWRDAR